MWGRDRLSPDLEKRSEVQGVGQGRVPYILSPIELDIEGHQISARVGWALIDEVPLLLGRLDLFDAFAIEFLQFDNKIRLTPQ